MKPRQQGFTLLEVLVATLIMAFAVVGLLGALHTSLSNAARLTSHDRMALVARAKMDELLVDYNLPLEAEMDGPLNPSETGGESAGFHVTLSVFQTPPQPVPGSPILQRILLHVWWTENDRPRTMDLEAYRRNTLPQAVQP